MENRFYVSLLKWDRDVSIIKINYYQDNLYS